MDTSGTYDIKSVSGLDTHGYICNGVFYPLSPSTNQLIHDDDSGGNTQFRFTPYLEAGVPYILVVTTHQSSATGPYSVVASGPGNVQFTPIDPT